jgi:ribosomal protein S18 acetylase RimI-like enzyme
MVTVEPARLSDVETLADLWVDLAVGQRAFGSHLRSAANREAIVDSLARSVLSDSVRVAREVPGDGAVTPADARIVGFVMFGLEVGGYEQDVVRGVVHNLYVAPDKRSDGVGSRLLTAAEAQLAAAGADVVSLEAMVANEDAIRFYEREGYHPHRVELEKPVENDTHSREDG